MKEFTTVDGAKVFVNEDNVIFIAAAMGKRETGPPVPILGMTMMVLQGAPPLVVKGGLEDVARRFVSEGVYAMGLGAGR